MYFLIVLVVYLRPVDEDAARRLKLKPGQKLYQFCYEKEPSQYEQEQRSSTDDDVYELLDATQESLNTRLLGCSALKPVSQRDKHSYVKRKVQRLQKAVASKVAKVLNIPTEELHYTEIKTPCEKCEDLDKFIELLKEK